MGQAIDLEAFFDRTGRVTRPPYRLLARELWSLLAYRPARPDPAGLPHGGGRAVLVVPAFLMGDASTRPFRAFLARCGFRPFGWEQGINWGPTPRLLAGLRQRFTELRRQEDRPVALVGISLGGVLARDLAQERPADVAHVVTIASPLRLPTATTIEPLLRACARYYSPAARPSRLARHLPVPSTAIFTREDGIVAAESCRSDEGGCAAIEVGGAHLTICRNPETLRAVVRRLAEADGRNRGTTRTALG